MTQEELEAGADGVKRVLEKYGYASFVDRDKMREVAAEVIRDYEKARAPKP